MIVPSRTLLLALALAVLVPASAAKEDDTPLKKGATCSAARREKIQRCLTDVAEQEAALPNGPCYSEDRRCYCIVQQGILDCWENNGCGDAQPKSQVVWNSQNCRGVNTAAGGKYAFDLTKVKSYSAEPEATTSSATTKKKDHKTRKHGSATSSDLAAATASTTPAPTLYTNDDFAADDTLSSSSSPALGSGFPSGYVAPVTGDNSGAQPARSASFAFALGAAVLGGAAALAMV